MPIVQLDDRALIHVTGDDAERFLQAVITTDVKALARDEMRPGALLTPQGKILFDFLISPIPSGFRLDCRKEITEGLLKRLMLYRLRARVEITMPDQTAIMVSWATDLPSTPDGSTVRDARFPAACAVLRHYGYGTGFKTANASEWTRLRVDNAIPESGSDYVLGDTFPHEALFDQTGGVSFTKGCYVGQEVVSRMQHRGTARKRIIMAEGTQALPSAGTEIIADGRPLGTMATVSGNTGLAMVRIDRVKEAVDAGRPITAGGVELTLSIPQWVDFTFPQTTETDGR